ncbi:class F sortase [Jatrophihabitans sp.]|uniref:class F sortase n=1 Tax=Jatrophihabitans sp. TaxID=1932789 RepID=UPI0030C66FA4|nr:peptidase sortase [Jatrophihabitans sp.]
MTITPTARRSPLPWVALVVAGVGAVVLALVLLAGRHDPRHAVPVVNVGALPATSAPASTVPSSSPSSSFSSRTTRHTVAAGTRLVLGQLHVNAPITAVHVTDGVMGVPRDPQTVGWWSDGAAPGDASGTTVLVGHVNYAGVSGALGGLPEARPGDVVSVGATHRYRITAVRTYPKTTGIPDDVFARSGPARLVLITCGGPFDSSTGNYEDNIVAYASPA